MNWLISPKEVFSVSPIVPVMVINKLENAVPLAKALFDGGIRIFEVTLRTDVALDAIRAIKKALPEALVGAGTVLTPEQYDAAVDAGSQFILSPGAPKKLLAHAVKQNIPLIPGVSTSTEIMNAMDFGYDHFKFFPAEANGGSSALKAISAPLSNVSFCPTGGINASNLSEYQVLDCVKTVGGTWMIPMSAIEGGHWDEITKLTKDALKVASNQY